MICRFHGGGSYTDTDTRPCPYCEVKGMRPVYDAAMAYSEDVTATPNPDEPHRDRMLRATRLEQALHEACRRAKEGR